MHIQLDASRIRTVRRNLLLASLAFLLANVVTVFFNLQLNQLLIEPRFFEAIQRAQNDVILLITANILPFPAVMIVIAIYLSPLVKRLRQGSLDDLSLRHLVNLPIFLSLLAAAGWVIGTIIFQTQLIPRGFTDDIAMVWQSTQVTLCMAAISFVLSYNLLDFIQRRYLVPSLFRGNEYDEIPGAWRPSLAQKFFIFILTTAVIPGFVTLRALQNLNAGGNNSLGRDLSGDFFMLYLIIGFTVIVITVLLVQSIRQPLENMRTHASRIQQGDFDVRTLVVTRDEIGSLSATLNTMTESLAEKEFIKDTFGRMVDPNVRDHLLQGNVNLGGVQGKAAILFSDLAGFTSLSEGQGPDRVVAILNRYFTAMADCISSEGGIINKFIGDAVLAVFGMPVEHDESADAALRAALKMQLANLELNRELESEGLKGLRTRIGLHYGAVIAGNIGSASRMEYTVIGDTVNTASRLESACKKVGCDILLSEQLKENLRHHHKIKTIGRLRLKGKSETVRAYTVLDGENPI